MSVDCCVSERHTSVAMKGCQSSNIDALSDVPKRSAPEPLLYLAYVNDIAADLDTGVSAKMLADYCIVYKLVNNILNQLLLNENVCKIAEKCERWHIVN